MVKPEIMESIPVNVVEVKDELTKIKKRDGELNYRSKKTEEYVKAVSQLGVKKAKELYQEIEKLNIPRIKDSHIHKFIEIMPLNAEDAKLILQGQPITVNNENLKKIVGVIDKYR